MKGVYSPSSSALPTASSSLTSSFIGQKKTGMALLSMLSIWMWSIFKSYCVTSSFTGSYPSSLSFYPYWSVHYWRMLLLNINIALHSWAWSWSYRCWDRESLEVHYSPETRPSPSSWHWMLTPSSSYLKASSLPKLLNLFLSNHMWDKSFSLLTCLFLFWMSLFDRICIVLTSPVVRTSI